MPPTRATHPATRGGRWRRQARGHGTATSPWSWTADSRLGDDRPEQGGRYTVEARSSPVDGWPDHPNREPLSDRLPSCPVEAAETEAGVIVVTRAPSDHRGGSVVFSEGGGLLASNPEICRYSEAREARVRPMGIGGTYGGTPMGVVVEIGGGRIYRAGDTGDFMARAAKINVRGKVLEPGESLGIK